MSPEEIQKEVFHAGWGIQTLTRGTRIVERPGWYQVISPGTISASRNEVIHSEIAKSDVERVIDETIAEYQAIGTPFKWCTSPWTTPSEFGTLLERRGFGSWLTRGMFVEIERMKITTPRGVSIELVTESNLDAYLQAFMSGWALDEAGDAQVQALLTEDMHWIFAHQSQTARFYLARVDGEPAGTAGYYLKERSGYLVGGNVLKKFRGRGVYRALIRARLQALRATGRTLAVTGARERTSAPILEKLGFETAFYDRIYQLGGILPE